ncbi:hypothetical protein NQ317_006606 [Molorchus minor]|uniref:Sodefrin-like factor n=1 Tax=Molorchus minor TaxID=1323400 RepID=A0ABQ9K0D8_9CUCU|nr:hypothetical protein NQ317_006606 [Molorchus minor]
MMYETVNRLFLVYANLLCYDCDAGPECEDPAGHNVRTVVCDKEYPNAKVTGDKLICLSLETFFSAEGRGFGFQKSGIYRGCNVIPSSVSEGNFCEHFKNNHRSPRFNFGKCAFCNHTRCVP